MNTSATETGLQIMSECQSCTIGSIQSNGHCDMCGFDEMQFINEWEEWREEEEAA